MWTLRYYQPSLLTQDMFIAPGSTERDSRKLQENRERNMVIFSQLTFACLGVSLFEGGFRFIIILIKVGNQFE